MRIYQDIDIHNPFQICDLLSASAWDNILKIQQADYLDELEELLESYDEWDLDDLDYFLCSEVTEIFPQVFDDGYEDDDE